MTIASSFRAALVCAFTCAALPSALAQAPAAPAAPAAPTLSAAHVDMAVDVVRLSGMSRSIDLIVPQMVDSASRLLSQMRPELTKEIEASIKTLQPDFAAMNATAQRIAGEAFATRLSESELKQIQAFFASEIGKKFVGVQPVLFSEMMRNLDAYSARLSQLVIDKIREDMKKRGLTL